MTTKRMAVLLAAALATAGLAPVPGAFAAGDLGGAGDGTLVSPSRIEQRIAVETTRSDDTRIEGRIVNHNAEPVTQVRLLVRDSFRWRNEFTPGGDDPGWAEEVVVPGPIPPGGSASFHVDRSRPERRDGRFETQIEVLGFVERPLRPAY